jgi:chromosome partitioning protein
MKKIVKFFKDHPCISVNCIEKAADLPKSTLAHALRGSRQLNEDHMGKLMPVLKKYGYQE